MRKITKQVQGAFFGGRTLFHGPSDRARNRDSIIHNVLTGNVIDQHGRKPGTYVEYRLHGSLLAYGTITNGSVHDVHIRTAGWDTPTTRDRLSAFGVRVSRYKGETYLNGDQWNGEWAKLP